MKNKTAYIILFFIIILGFLLRFTLLGSVPVGFHRDEASLGYNAYSILKTGKELAGNFLPLHLKSFLYSPAGYTYFSIPFVLIFGLNEFASRFASALFGLLTIPLTFLLVRLLFSKFKNSNLIALIAAFFLAISPWNINLSRVSTDNVIVVFFITLGVILYHLWNQKNKWYLLIFSFLCFTISLFTYQAPRGFLPFFLPLMFIYYSYKDRKKLFISFLLYFIFIIIPIISVLLSPDLSIRIRMLSIFNSPSTQLVLDEQLREDGVMKIAPVFARVFHNKILSYAGTFILNYTDHFSFRFLFTDSGFPDRYRVPGFGLLYLFDLPLIVFGIWNLFSKNKKLLGFLLGWVLLAPIGSALTYDDIPNLQRTLMVFPALSIIPAFGLIGIWEYLKSYNKIKYLKESLIVLAIIITGFSFSSYLFAYYVQQVVHKPLYREEGYKKLVSSINALDKNNKYKLIVVANPQSDASILFAYFNVVDPTVLQPIFAKVKNGEYGEASFGKYKFVKDECPVREISAVNTKSSIKMSYVTGEKDVLYVDSGFCQLPTKGISILSRIYRSDGVLVFVVIKLQGGSKNIQ